MLAGLGACSRNEPQERAALIGWLDQHARPGLLLTPPDEATLKQFGGYARQYAVIGDYQAVLNRAAGVIRETLSALPAHAIEDVVARRDSLQALRASLHRQRQDLEAAYQRAVSQRADLLQAPDLKAAYDRMFDSSVVQTRSSLLPLLDLLDGPISAAIALADFAVLNQDQIASFGELTQVRDPSVQTQLNQRVDQFNAQSSAVQQARALCLEAALCSPTMSPSSSRPPDDS